MLFGLGCGLWLGSSAAGRLAAQQPSVEPFSTLLPDPTRLPMPAEPVESAPGRPAAGAAGLSQVDGQAAAGRGEAKADRPTEPPRGLPRDLAGPWTWGAELVGDPYQLFKSAPPPQVDVGVQLAPAYSSDFLPTPFPPGQRDAAAELGIYYGRMPVPVQSPWLDLWRPFYGSGLLPPAIPLTSPVNPLMPRFVLYGDYRTGVGVHKNAGLPVRQFAHRLNLDLDLRLTATERVHAFFGPLDSQGRFTRFDFSQPGQVEFEQEFDMTPNTLFFEGDVGAMWGGWVGQDAPFDLPITIGLIPLIYQNGIWMEDAILGAAIGFPWRHSVPLDWSNFDMSFFGGLRGVTSPAFDNDNGGAGVLGTAWFIEAYQGYVEADYAFLFDRRDLDRDYHNASLAYTRRYFNRFSNSVRMIVNTGQGGPRADRTADGGLLLIENALITSSPYRVIPYMNLFYGFGRPQSVGRAGGSGGILRNTGIAFESDGLTGYPTLDDTGANTYGGAVGLNLLSADFTRQMVGEFGLVEAYGDPQARNAAGRQFGAAARYQQALNNWTLFRVDLLYGWLENSRDTVGTRFEYRWKF
jgi:hypothetical protein